MKKHMPYKGYVFLDRDGTVIVDKNFLSDYRMVELIPGAAQGLKKIRDIGLGLIIITNQSGIGRGYFTYDDLSAIHEYLLELLSREGVFIDEVLFCPHIPQDRCECRKPKTGLIKHCADKYGFNAADCFMVGDRPCDIETGKGVGAKTILVKTGYGSSHIAEGYNKADFVAENLFEAANIIELFYHKAG